MRLSSRLIKLAGGLNPPRRTVRLRLTVLYGSLFLVSGAALLGITYLLVRHSTGNVVIFAGEAEAPRQANLEGLRLVDPEQLRRLRLAPERFDGSTIPTLPVPEEFAEIARDRREQAASQRAEQLRQLLVQSGVALALMAVVSIGLGWLIAGRVLRPLRTMTATTRRISAHNLDQRLALEGPDDELKDLGDTIDDLLERLEKAFDAQRRFVANASHELRTPLTMMRTSLDVSAAKPEASSPEARRLEGKLREGLDRADRLLEDFLTLARTQHGALPGADDVPLRDVVSAAIEARAGEIEERGIAVETELGDVVVRGSHTLLAHLAENVIDNAIRHNEPSGWIRAETATAGAAVRLVVENGGPALDPDEVEALAQPFRRVHGERTASGDGVGLGLSIVAAIVAAHDGGLELRARPQGGLRIAIELPAIAAPQPDLAPADPIPRAAESGAR